jgi:UPF0755 protein
MIKKIFILTISLIIIFAGWSAYSSHKKRLDAQKQVQNAKAPQQKITLIEGWDNVDIGKYLEKNKVTTLAEFLDAQKNFDYSAYPILALKPKGLDLEGFIFPDTYFIPESVATGTSINSIILKKALDNFSQKITPKIIANGEKNGLNLFKLITLASILEKESGKDLAEKKIIAGIFYNRLNINMALQSDATVNYITNKGKTRPSLEDISIDSPYNTYNQPGLPPGPISNPGLDSIIAASEPTKTDYFYFLSDPITDKAIFSKTHEEHVANKRKYLK